MSRELRKAIRHLLKAFPMKPKKLTRLLLPTSRKKKDKPEL
jgi:hypothetical protein